MENRDFQLISQFRGMYEAEYFAKLLKIRKPWFVLDGVVDEELNWVTLTVNVATEKLPCPECGIRCSRYDTRLSRWRHLDTMEYQTEIQCDVPRIRCAEHGVLKVRVPWAEPLSRYTIAFESLVIDWMLDASVSTVAGNLGMSWNAVDNIMRRAVERGMHRRKKSRPKHIAIDETSFQKRHERVSVVTNQETGAVDYVADGRTEEALNPYYKELGTAGCART